MRLIDADELIKSLKPFEIGEQQIYGCGSWHFVDKCINTINIMSTIEPERKKGKWIDTGSGQECSECHEIQYGYDNFRYFCGFCGADMREGENNYATNENLS